MRVADTTPTRVADTTNEPEADSDGELERLQRQVEAVKANVKNLQSEAEGKEKRERCEAKLRKKHLLTQGLLQLKEQERELSKRK